MFGDSKRSVSELRNLDLDAADANVATPLYFEFEAIKPLVSALQ